MRPRTHTRPAALLMAIALALAPEALGRRRAVGHPQPFTVPALEAIGAAAVAGGLPGVTIAVRKGNDLYVQSWGAPPAGHVYQIASVSKQFTAAAIMRLVEAGRVRLDEKARAWLPELDERFDAITIEHLLTHTSGLREYTSQLTDAYAPKSQQEIVAMIAGGPLRFAPGTRWEYSNSGYFLLGMIIERASSQMYAQFLRDTFFAPLALRKTSYCEPGPDGHVIVGNVPQRVRAADMSLVYAAGALCSSADDLLRWSEALASGRAVTPQSYARMTTGVAPSLAPAPGYGYALVLDTYQGRRRIWHNGGILGFQSHLAHFPDEQLTIAVLVDAYDPERDRATELANAVARAMK